MRRKCRLTTLTAVLCLSLHAGRAFARADDKKFKDAGELSYVDSSGNTNSTSLSFTNKMDYLFNPKTSLAWTAGGLYTKTGTEKSAERYFTDLKGERKVTEKVYGYLQTGWLRDPFAGIDARYNGGAGAGYQLYKTAANDLKADAGFNYLVEERTTKEIKHSPSAVANVNYKLNITETILFGQDLYGNFDMDGGDNYESRSVTSFQASINSFLAWKNSYTVFYKHKPVPGFGTTDRTFATALVITL